MDSISNEAFDSDETVRCFQVENYDEHEFADDDELSENIELCLGEVDKIIERSSETLLSINDVKEPYIDMEFKSRDDAREFYIAYGRRIGFTVRIHHNRRSRINNMIIGQDFVCSKEGFREKKYVHRKDRVLPPPPVTREGCRAMLRLALKDGVRWVVTKFIEEHNHALMSPSKVPWRGSAKSLVSEAQSIRDHVLDENWILLWSLIWILRFEDESWTKIHEPSLFSFIITFSARKIIYAVAKKALKDEKDRRIRELTIELNNEKQRCKRRCAAYQEQLRMVLSYVEGHTIHLSNKVQDIVNNVKELENEEVEDSDCKYV